ncbi:PGPGW domain-containing protein [Streptomonospora nanhaiensis]|uniref:PGPGW domain-containing protein n=1 Tax=Streptomonospora nanhaiensis TaxID=1323731 RepID=UPI0020CB1239|nr:PGPGW domain-containing protein [Streptomonospora nanhaiensis]
MSPSPMTDRPDPAASPTTSTRAHRPSRRWRRFRTRLRVWRLRMHAHPVLSWTWRGVVATVGLFFVLAGVVMCVTPGPGAAAIVLGLAVLATEFAWAKHLLRRARHWAHAAKEKAKDRAVRSHPDSRLARLLGARPSAGTGERPRRRFSLRRRARSLG